MLVLTRKKDQTVHINHEVEVVVLEIRHDRVRLGIRAPREIAVHRGEIEARFRAEEVCDE